MRLDYSVYDTDNKGQLNPDWVELLMGLPIGWTDIDKDELTPWPGWPAPMNANRQWATPNTMDMLPSRSYEAMKHQATNGARKNRTAPGNLREQIDPLMRKAYVEASKENGGKLTEEMTVSGQYPYEPPRVVEGQKNRAKRLKCLGNGCVPAQIYPIFKAIMEAEK
jgi:DNA (cytosine-5)-methyltransferase 1